MDKNKLLMIGAIAGMVLVVALGFVVGIQPQLSAASAASAQQSTVVSENIAQAAKLTKLKADYAKLPSLKAELSSVQTSIPSTPSLASFISDLDALAAAAGVKIGSFTPGPVTAYAPPVKAAAAAGSTGAAATTPSSPKLVTDPSITGQNFFTIPVTVTVYGPEANSMLFLTGLQNGERLFSTTTFTGGGAASSTDPGAAGNTNSFTITGNIYVLTPTAAPVPTTTGAAGTAGSTGTASPAPAG